MAGEEETQREEQQPPATAPSTESPQWAIDLRRAIDELPGKLRASVSDDDKTGIAEAVHGLFERSGAFKPETETQETERETQTTEQQVERTETETPPKKASGLARFAQWFAGE